MGYLLKGTFPTNRTLILGLNTTRRIFIIVSFRSVRKFGILSFQSHENWFRDKKTILI